LFFCSSIIVEPWIEMHSSFFAYNVTRPYPFKWFTPVVLIGVVIATTLFSFLNFVSTGYNLEVEYSTNPNATISDGIWFNHWPSFLTSKVQPTCQALDIQPNTKFFTNQTGLTYTLTNVWQPSTNEPSGILSSLTYYNNPIEDCVVQSIEINLESMDRSMAQFAWQDWGAVFRANVTCRVTSDAGQVDFTLLVDYDYVPDTVSYSSGLYTLLSIDKDTRASLWWGQSLLSMYWINLSLTMQQIGYNDTANNQIGIRKGNLLFTPSTAKPRLFGTVNPPDSTATDNITDLDYFDVDYRFLVDGGQGGSDYVTIYPGFNNFSTTLNNLYYEKTYPNIWIQADSAAKSFQSTVLTDLGQKSSRIPNILTNATALQFFTSNFSKIMSSTTGINALPGPAVTDYNSLKASTGLLGTTPSVISTNYLCQVPRRKATGSLIVAILLADLVFLQALWQLFLLITNTWLLTKEKQGPEVNYCEGCLGNKRASGYSRVRSRSRDRGHPRASSYLNARPKNRG
jgi:hypothetical protein